MGGILSALGASGLSLCNQNKMRIGNVFCCIRRNKSENFGPNTELENSDCDKELKKRKKKKEHDAHDTGDSNSSDEFKDELTVNSDNTFLSNHPITKSFYINKNIGHFTTDTNGVPTYVSDNMIRFIGLPRDQILQSISWVKNIAIDNYHEYTEWAKHAKEKRPYVKRMHFTLDGKHNYIIAEFHPIFDEVNYVGVHGVFLKVSKHTWQAFNEKDFHE